MDLASVMQWMFYLLIGILCLVGLPLALDLLYRIWRQVLLGQVQLDVNLLDYCDAANEILGRKEKVDVGTWLTGKEFDAVEREVKRRYAEFGAIQKVARGLSGDVRARIIRLQVEGCLAELAGEGGGRSRLIFEEGSFRIESERPLQNDAFEVAFSGRAWRESERLATGDDAPIPVEGRIELDSDLRTRHGADGKAALSPYRTLVPPARWTDGARRALSELRASFPGSGSDHRTG